MFLVVIDSDHIILSTMLLLAGEKVERLSLNLVFMALSVEQRLLYFKKEPRSGQPLRNFGIKLTQPLFTGPTDH